MNKHLKVFRHFHHSEENDVIENNLTRALAFCFKHDQIFLFHFLGKYLVQDDWNSILGTKSKSANIEVDIQRETSELVEQCRKLYAIALTERVLDFSDVLSTTDKADKINITDLVIQINDISIIFEVKRTGEDCRYQLIQQSYPFKEAGKSIEYKSLAWNEILTMLFQVRNFYIMNNKSSVFIDDFITLVKERYPSWIPSTPFKYLTLQDHDELYKRLHRCMRATSNGENLLETYDRTAMRVNKPWASEIIPYFEGKDLAVCIWPGNTKTQGWHVYGKDMQWRNKTTLNVDGEIYPLVVEREFKLCHFNKFIGGVNAADQNLKAGKETHTYENFESISGWIDRSRWIELEKFLDDHLKIEWRAEAGWNERFVQTDRSYLTLSLGFYVRVLVPYEKLQELDTEEAGYTAIARMLDQIELALIQLFEGTDKKSEVVA